MNNLIKNVAIWLVIALVLMWGAAPKPAPVEPAAKTAPRQVVRAERAEEIESLENKPYAAQPQISEKIICSISRDFVPHHFNAAGRHLVDAADEIQQRSLAAAARPP